MTLLFPCLRRALCSLSGVVVLTGATGAERPNVILIFADDLGPGLLGSYGQQLIKTPHLDKLAASIVLLLVGPCSPEYTTADWAAGGRREAACSFNETLGKSPNKSISASSKR